MAVSTSSVVVPNVIDQETCEKALGDVGHGKRIVDADSLALSYQNILKIDNLAGFEKLKRLQLDNNIIASIENLDHLVNLETLDLSFNNITKIENLNNMTNLTSLSLFNNHISELTGLDSLKKLEVLSVGNNLISDTGSIMYLRPFENLHVLTMSGNPIEQEADYRPFILAHLKHLKFLDYRLIDEQAVQSAMEQFQDTLQELHEEDEAVRADAATAAEKAKRLAQLREAGVEQVEPLKDELLAPSEGEVGQLWGHPTLTDSLNDFRERLEEAIDEFVEAAFEQHAVKQAEKSAFEEALNAIRSEAAETSRTEISNYSQLVKDATFESGGTLTASQTQSLEQANIALFDTLMDIEMLQGERCSEGIQKFEITCDELSKKSLEMITAFFNRVREVESQFQEGFLSATAELLDDSARHTERADDISEELKSLLRDKVAVTNALVAAHDARGIKVDAHEDEMRSNEISCAAALVSAKHTEEHDRKRARVNEIWNLVHVINMSALSLTYKN